MSKKYGVLLINLGTPSDCDPASVRVYLREFLNDPRVIDLPWLIRKILLNFIILPFRPKESAKAYQKIWTEKGSPLLTHSIILKKALDKEFGSDMPIEIGMRYGSPSIASALNKLDDVEHLIVVPLFPQYSSAATGSAIEKVYQEIKSKRTQPNLVVIRDFFSYPGFLDAQAKLIAEKKVDPTSHLLFSYHGLPEQHLLKGGCKSICAPICPQKNDNPISCYRKQCYQTTHEIAKRLNLTEDQYTTSFQSRLGKTPWIKPYTDHTLENLREQGIKNIAIVCPSFIADCLETLEEIGMQAKEQWHSLGGEGFQLIECLNNEPTWVTALAKLIRQNLHQCSPLP